MSSETTTPSAPLHADCSTDVMDVDDILYKLVRHPTASNLWDIAGRARSQKEAIFKEMGWDVNHKITEGDVRCVLSALVSVLRETSP